LTYRPTVVPFLRDLIGSENNALYNRPGWCQYRD